VFGDGVAEPILGNCSLHPLAVRGDERGSLIALETARDVPFEIARVYFVYATLPGVDRGFHAHRTLRQLAVCVNGSCTMVLDDGSRRIEVPLDKPDLALSIGPMVWHEMRDFSPQCVLMVLADAPYEEKDYIRQYDAFLKLVRAGHAL
jgi:dTDP-4-dehydrorhamnose 3,5-epimerase-like enzyme